MVESFNEINLIVEHLKRKNNINVLDLGCGNGKFLIEGLIEIYKKGIDLKKGIAIDDLRDLNGMYIINGFDENDLKAYYNNWRKMWEITYAGNELGSLDFPKDINVKEFFKKIDFYFCDNENFLSNNTTQFDLIILSNVLHFIINEKERFELYDLVFKSLNKGGVFYIKVANDKHSYSEQEDKITFNKDLFLEEIEKTEFKLKSEVIYVENHLHILLTKDKKPCLKKLLKKQIFMVLNLLRFRTR